MAQKVQKAKYWTAVLYPESMVDDWQDKIYDLLQIPFCYCIHDKDVLHDSEEERKTHVHVVIAFNNTTTFKHALSVFQRLQGSCSYCEQVLNIRYIYDYLIHNTDSCRKQNKHIYDISERVCGNDFDIGNFEQISITEKRKMLKELCDHIYNNKIMNFIIFYSELDNSFSPEYFEIVSSYSGFLERLCKGNYLLYHGK